MKVVNCLSKKFRFLWFGGHSLPYDRKGGDDLVKAFHEEFKLEESVELIMKINTVYSGNFDSVGHLKSVSNDDPRITYIISDMSEKERADLYRSADCYVMPTKGEAFGMTGLEALACGLPNITTGYSGVMDYCDDENSFIIRKWDVWPAHYGYFDIISCSNWVRPDFNELKRLMRYAYEHPEECRLKGLLGAELAKEEFTWLKQAQKTIESIERWEKRVN